jgi:hypothetical protein
MKKGFRTIHCRIINKDGSEYPSAYSDSVNDERQYLRAIVGFDALDMNQSVAFKNCAVWATKNDSYPAFGQSYLAKQSFDRVYSAQIFEEAVGVYVSNVFDGGKDFRFWKSISWDPTSQADPAGMDVEFYVRTASTEDELTGNVRKWNNVGSNSADGEIILEKFTNATGNNLVRFSQQASVLSSPLEETIVNRFLQFKMVLKSRSYNQVPRVNDVTISYSKQNTVNFFTTTFDLKSNILRAILTYNGDTGLDVNGVALSDIQFGISTTEELDGTVSTNFDDYKIVPVNEVFGIEDVGLEKNDKFRVGIRFISSADNVPTVDEFAVMWESEKNPGNDTDQFVQNKDL